MASSTPEQSLRAIGLMAGNDVPVAQTLLLLGTYDGAPPDLSRYESHLVSMHQALQLACKLHPIGESEDLLAYRLKHMNDVIRHEYGYAQDDEGFDIVDHINMQTVIDRRKGIPVALGVLYMDLAERQQWPIAGLNFPGHFLLCLTQGPQKLIFDPYYEGMVMDAAKMRHLLKTTIDAKAELSHDYYTFVTHRDVILRFYNNRKTRLIASKAYAPALDIAKRLLWVAPDETRLYFDAGVLSLKASLLIDASEYLEKFIKTSKDKASIVQAKQMLATLHRQLQ